MGAVAGCRQPQETERAYQRDQESDDAATTEGSWPSRDPPRGRNLASGRSRREAEHRDLECGLEVTRARLAHAEQEDQQRRVKVRTLASTRSCARTTVLDLI